MTKTNLDNRDHQASDCPQPSEKYPLSNSKIENQDLERVIVDFVGVWGTDQFLFFLCPGRAEWFMSNRREK